MTLQDDIAALEEKLDPAMRAAFALLRKTNEDLTESNKALTEEVAKLTAQVAKYQKMLFGPKSEKLPPIQSEVRRAVEAEELFGQADDDTAPEDGDEEEAQKQRRIRGRAASEPKRKKNRKLRKNLPVIRERVLVQVEDIPESYTLEDFREVGQNSETNIIRRIEHVREHLVVMEYELQTLASRDNEHIITAAAPPSVTEGGHYGPSVYAHDVVSRCEFSLPHNRLGKMLGAAEKVPDSLKGTLRRRSLFALRTLHGHPVVGIPNQVKDIKTEIILVAVAADGAREKIAAHLLAIGLPWERIILAA